MEPDWSEHCAGFAADHVKKATGRDIWKELGGKPDSPKTAADLYRKHKVRSMRKLVSKVLGDEILVAYASRGDVVMVDNALGICRGDLAEFMDRMQPMHRAEAAWKVTGKPQLGAARSRSKAGRSAPSRKAKQAR